MRNAFAKTITELAQKDPRVTVLSGDIGNRLFDDLKAKCPDRFYNCGVAEANMIGMATGLTMSGMKAFCYTITPFLTYRCMEQIRIDVCYHRVPVVIVGTGSGLSYASLGVTHHSCEEMGMLRLLPGLTVVAPADAAELRACLRATLSYPHPVYIRIGKKGEPQVHASDPDFTIGKAIPIQTGTRFCFLSTGIMLPEVIKTAELLKSSGISPQIYSFHTVKPLDEACLMTAFSEFDVVVTIEEHSILGGLGGSVAEWLADHPGMKGRLLRIGTRDEFLHETSEKNTAREYFGLTAPQMAKRLKESE